MATKRKKVTLIPGDGIGPEVADAVVEIIGATGVNINWDIQEAGAHVAVKYGTPLPENVVDSIKFNKMALKGPVGTPIGEGFASVNVELRKKLSLFANLRPVKSIKGIKTRYEDVDLIVVRENTESLYSGLEHLVVPGVVESLKIITEKASLAIAEFAFNFAAERGRKKVTAVHKANIMKLSDGLFLECTRRVASKYPEIEYEEVIVDALCMKLVEDPSRFDVLLLENLYGDIISDLCAGMVGGLGIVPSGNFGEKIAVFEAVHGSAPDIAGKGIANPTALLQSGLMMLRCMGEFKAAERLFNALVKTLNNKKAVTPDLGGSGTTKSFTRAVIKNLARA
jgi:isocitrate dehydrogenase (NAD+)